MAARRFSALQHPVKRSKRPNERFDVKQHRVNIKNAFAVLAMPHVASTAERRRIYRPCARAREHGRRPTLPAIVSKNFENLRKHSPRTSFCFGAALGCSATCCCSASAMVLGPVEDVIPLPRDVISFFSNSVVERCYRSSTFSSLNNLLWIKHRHTTVGSLFLSHWVRCGRSAWIG